MVMELLLMESRLPTRKLLVFTKSASASVRRASLRLCLKVNLEQC